MTDVLGKRLHKALGEGEERAPDISLGDDSLLKRCALLCSRAVPPPTCGAEE
jgi:hypothetical protein